MHGKESIFSAESNTPVWFTQKFLVCFIYAFTDETWSTVGAYVMLYMRVKPSSDVVV